MGIDEFIAKPLTAEAIGTLVTKVKRQQSLASANSPECV
jgi:hypothetical protein